MAPQSRLVSDTELEVLKAVWELGGEGTVREVQAVLNRDGRDWAYTTTQTLLGRLRDKGFVERHKKGRAFVFRAVVTRDDLVGRSLEDLADRVCDGAPLPLLLNLVQSARFERKDIDRFRALLDELEKGGE